MLWILGFFSQSVFDFSKIERTSVDYIRRLGLPISASTLTAEVFYRLFKEENGCTVGLAVVTKEFRRYFSYNMYLCFIA